MKTVIVTGGIGGGKSTVCRILERDYACPVYDADKRVKELYQESPFLLNDIELALGERFRDADGVFQPSLLAARIFSDPAALAEVESLVFPVMMEDFQTWKAGHSDKRFAVLESATIMEKPELSGLGDYLVVVDAPLQMRVDRAVRRDRASYDSILGRVCNQRIMNEISAGAVPASVDYVIMNDGGLETLSAKVEKCVESLDL